MFNVIVTSLLSITYHLKLFNIDIISARTVSFHIEHINVSFKIPIEIGPLSIKYVYSSNFLCIHDEYVSGGLGPSAVAVVWELVLKTL